MSLNVCKTNLWDKSENQASTQGLLLIHRPIDIQGRGKNRHILENIFGCRGKPDWRRIGQCLVIRQYKWKYNTYVMDKTRGGVNYKK